MDEYRAGPVLGPEDTTWNTKGQVPCPHHSPSETDLPHTVSVCLMSAVMLNVSFTLM